MPYSLAYADRFQRVNQPLKLENSFDCDNVHPFKPLSSGLNALRLNVTASEFKLLWSSVVTGSELMFPEQSLTLQQILLNAADCIEDNSLGQGCVKYPTFSSLIAYAPQNPFTQPDLTPSGYLKPPFSRWGEFESILPDWANEWLGGIVEWATGYQTNDVLCDIGSLPIFANWFELLANGLPRLEIAVSGEGKISLELLAIPLGGMAIISVDNPIDIGDIFASIIDPNLRIIELNRDILSVPPETDVTHIEEIEISGLGNHTIYVQFVPVVDDALIPVRFGGGLRSIELCGFDAIAPSEGIMDIRLTECGIEALIDGQWIEKISQAELKACFPEPVVEIRGATGTIGFPPFQSNFPSLEYLKNGEWIEVQNWAEIFGLDWGQLNQTVSQLNEQVQNQPAVDALQNTQIVNLQNQNVTQEGQISQLFTDVSDLFDADASQGTQIANLINADTAINNQLATIVSVNNTQNSQIFALQDSISELLTLGSNFWGYDRNFADFSGNANWNLIVGGWDTLGFFETQESNYTEIAIAHNAASIDANWFAVVRLNVALDVAYNVELLELSAFGLPHEAYFKRLAGNACVGYVKVPNLENAPMSFNLRFQQENVPFRLQSIRILGIGLTSFPSFGGDASFNASF